MNKGVAKTTMATDDRFELAAQRMRENKALSLSNESKLQLYGYYKQVSTLSHPFAHTTVGDGGSLPYTKTRYI